MDIHIPLPSELQSFRDQEHSAAADAAIAAIVRAMKSATSTTINESISVPHGAQDLVRRRLAIRGWNIAYHDDQREGPWVVVTPIAK